jgi:hypothetical protein
VFRDCRRAGNLPRGKGQILWQQKKEDPLIGGVSTIVGGLVFRGEGKGDFLGFRCQDGRTAIWKQLPLALILTASKTENDRGYGSGAEPRL